MPRALILGGTGAVGRATALRLLEKGWRVDLTGRNPERFDPTVRALGGHYVESDRFERRQLAAVVGEGADLLVDCACYTAAHAHSLVSCARDAGSTVMLSSKAVYVDERGRHSNSPAAPVFAGPIHESQATMRPSSAAYNSPEGYGANKIAAEIVLLDSALAVSVLRPSKIHGVGARRAREWYFVKRVLDRRPSVMLAAGGRGVDHPTAALNLAALIEVVAASPGRRVLNIADPDAPSALEISRIVAGQLGHGWREVLLEDDAPQDLGRTPWSAPSPVVLDTSAAAALGYVAVGDYATTVRATLSWLASRASREHGAEAPDLDAAFFTTLFDYEAEDAYLSART